MKTGNSTNNLHSNEALSFILHQDNLMWSRLQTMGIIQIGALSSAYAIRTIQWLAVAILTLGILLTLLTFFLLKRDELQRLKIEQHLKQLNFAVPRRWFAPLKGREIAWLLFVFLIISDVVLGIAILRGLL